MSEQGQRSGRVALWMVRADEAAFGDDLAATLGGIAEWTALAPGFQVGAKHERLGEVVPEWGGGARRRLKSELREGTRPMVISACGSGGASHAQAQRCAGGFLFAGSRGGHLRRSRIRARFVFLGLLRDGRPFDRAEKELLGLIQPHLSNGRKLALAVTAAEHATLAPELFAAVGFTPRESDVLYWLTRGKSNDEIAKILRIRADSVSRHLHTIYDKMGVEHRVAATIGAVELARKLHAESLSVRGGGILLTVPRAL